MIIIKKLQSIFLILGIILFSCNSDERPNNERTLNSDEKSLIEVNKYLVQKDAEVIESYIERRKWKMERTETGLYYMIYKKGDGMMAKPGLLAEIKYEISLLDGTVCYKSDSLVNKVFQIGKGGVESGLEQGILLMHKGDKAKFIMPPHLAHGLLGDENKIPPRSTIVYDVDLINLSN